MKAPVRAALYAQCSNGHQDIRLQLDTLLRLTAARG